MYFEGQQVQEVIGFWLGLTCISMLSSLICLVTLTMMPTFLIVTQIKTWNWFLGKSIIVLPPYHSSTTLRPENLANFPYLYTSWNFHIDTQNDALENVSLFNYPFSYYHGSVGNSHYMKGNEKKGDTPIFHNVGGRVFMAIFVSASISLIFCWAFCKY